MACLQQSKCSYYQILISFWAPSPRKSCPLYMPAVHLYTDHVHLKHTCTYYTYSTFIHTYFIHPQYMCAHILPTVCIHTLPTVHIHTLYTTSIVHAYINTIYIHSSCLHTYTVMPKAHINSFVVTNLKVKANCV